MNKLPTEVDASQAPIFLLGFRGTGKTSLGRRLARRLNRSVVDLDELIEAKAGRSIAEIFATAGEPVFRDLESEVLKEVCDQPGLVVATGGGVILREENRNCLQHGFRVLLLATPEEIVRRLQADEARRSQRPALTNKSLEAEVKDLLAERDPVYRSCADAMVISRTDEEESIVSDIAQQWSDWLSARENRLTK